MNTPTPWASSAIGNSQPHAIALTGRCTHLIARAFSFPFDIHSALR